MANNRMDYTIGFRADTTQLRKGVQDAINQLKGLNQIGDLTLTKSLHDAVVSANELSNALAKATNINTGKLDLSVFNSTLKQSGRSIEEYARELNSLGPVGQKAFLSVAEAVIQAEAPLMRTSQWMDKLWVTMQNTIRWRLTTGALDTFIGGLQTAYGYSKNLNESLTNIRVVSGQSTEQMAEFARQANKAAQSLSSTTIDYTDAALIYYQQGLNTGEVEERTNATIKMANVTRQSAEEVSDQLTAIWNNFADGSKSLEYYADVITALGAATASSSTEISTGLEKFAAVAETVGLSYEYATAALATVTATTRQSADVVGTAFRTLFARIQDLELGKTLDDGTTLGKYAQALDAVGISIKDSSGEMKDMNNILDGMGEKWQTLSKDTQIALAQAVAGTRQYTQLIALMDNYDFFKQNVNVAVGAEGTLTKQQEIYAEGWEAARDRVRSAAEDIYDSLIDEEFFIKVANSSTKFLNVIDDIVDSLGGMGGILNGLAYTATVFLGDKIAVSMRNMAANAGIWLGFEKQKTAEIQKGFQEQLKNLDLFDREQAGLAERERLLEEEYSLKQKINEIDVKLTSAQKDAIVNEERLVALSRENLKTRIDNLEAASRQASTSWARTRYNGAEFSEEQQVNIRQLTGSFNNLRNAEFLKNFDASQGNVFVDTLKQITREQIILNERSNLASTALERFNDQLSDSKNKAEQTKGSIAILNETFGIAAKNSTEMKEALQHIVEEGEDTDGIIEDLETSLNILTGNGSQFVETERNMANSTLDVNNGLGVLRERTEQAKLKVDEIVVSGRDWADTLTMIAGQLFQVSMAFQAIERLPDIVSDENLTASEKFTQVLTNLMQILPVVITLSKVLGAAKMAEAKANVEATATAVANAIATKASEETIAAAKAKHAAAQMALNTALLPYIGIALAIVAIVGALVVAYDKLTISTKEAKENFEKMKGSLDDNKNELKSLNDELETTKKRIEELEAKDSLSFLEQNELNKLRSAQAQMELLIKKKAELAKIDADKQLASFESSWNALSKDFNSAYKNFTDGYLTTGVYDITTEAGQKQYLYDGGSQDNLDKAIQEMEAARFALLESQQENYQIAYDLATISGELDNNWVDLLNGLANDLQRNRDEQYTTFEKFEAFVAPLLESDQFQEELILERLRKGEEAFKGYQNNKAANSLALSTGVSIDAMETMLDDFYREVSEKFSSKYGEAAKGWINTLNVKELTEAAKLNIDKFSSFTQAQAALAKKVAESAKTTFDYKANATAISSALDEIREKGELSTETIEKLKEQLTGLFDLTGFENMSLMDQAQALSEMYLKNVDASVKEGLQLARQVESLEATKKSLEGQLQYGGQYRVERAGREIASTLEGEYELVKTPNGEMLLTTEEANRYRELNDSLATARANMEASDRGGEQDVRQTDFVIYQNQVRELNGEINDYLDTLSDRTGEVQTKIGELSNEYADSIREELKDVDAQIDETVDRLQNIVIDPIQLEVNLNAAHAIAAMDSVLTKAASYIDENYKVTGDNIEKLAKTLPELFKGAVQEANGAVQLSAKTVAEVQNKYNEQLGKDAAVVAERFQAIRDEIAPLLDSLEDISIGYDQIRESSYNSATGQIEDATNVTAANQYYDSLSEQAKHDLFIATAKYSASKKLKEIADSLATQQSSSNDVKQLDRDTLTATNNMGRAFSQYFTQVARMSADAFRVMASNMQAGLSGKGSVSSYSGHYTAQGYNDNYTVINKKQNDGSRVSSLLAKGLESSLTDEEAKELREKAFAEPGNGGLKDKDIEAILPIAQSLGMSSVSELVEKLSTGKSAEALYEQAKNTVNGAELLKGLNDAQKALFARNAETFVNMGKAGNNTDLVDAGKGKDKTGGGGSEKKIAPKEKERYHEINKLLEKQNDLLDQIDEKTDRAYGYSKISLFERQIEALKELNSLYEQKVSEANEYLKKDIEAISNNALLDSLGVKIDKERNLITNYEDVMGALVDAYNKGTIDDDTYNAASKLLDKYEDTADLLADLNKDLQETARKIVDTRLQKIEETLNVRVDLKDARKQLNDFSKEIAESYSDAIYHGMSSLNLSAANAKLELNMADAYQDNFDSLLEEIANTVDPTDRSKLISDLDSLRQEVIGTGEELLAFVDELENAIPEAIDAACARFSQFTDVLEHNVSVLQNITDLINLTNINKTPSETYKLLGKTYSAILKTSFDNAKLQRDWTKEAQIRFQEAQIELASRIEGTAEWDIAKKQLDSLLEEYKDHQTKMLSLTKDTLNAAKDLYDNNVKEIMANMEATITGGDNFDIWQRDFDRYQDLEERYLDPVNRLYEINKLNNKINESLDKQMDGVGKDILQRLKEEVALRNQDVELAQYDVDLLNAKYELALKQIALEEAQNAKNSVRLVRNGAGNWDYMFTANQDEVSKAQQEYEDAQNKIYNLTKEQVKKTSKEIVKAYQDMAKDIEDIYNNNALTVDQKEQEIAKIREYWKDIILGLEKDKNEAIQDMTLAGMEAIEGFSNQFGKDLDYMSTVTEDFDTLFDTTIDNLNQNAEEFNDTINDVCGQMGLSWEELSEAIDNVTESSEDAAKQAYLTSIQMWDAIDSITDQTRAYSDLCQQIREYLSLAQQIAGKTVEEKAKASYDSNDLSYSAALAASNGDFDIAKSYLAKRKTPGNGIETDRIMRVIEAAENYDAEALAIIRKVVKAGQLTPGWKNALQNSSFSTGGYTGEWGENGRIAFVHEKELILNKQDTENILQAVSVMQSLSSSALNDIISSLDTQSILLQQGYTNGISRILPSSIDNNSEIQQTVSIEATFPGVQQAIEIEAALRGLIDNSIQYAN